jgi:hypothetical protein
MISMSLRSLFSSCLANTIMGNASVTRSNQVSSSMSYLRLQSVTRCAARWTHRNWSGRLIKTHGRCGPLPGRYTLSAERISPTQITSGETEGEVQTNPPDRCSLFVFALTVMWDHAVAHPAALFPHEIQLSEPFSICEDTFIVRDGSQKPSATVVLPEPVAPATQMETP